MAIFKPIYVLQSKLNNVAKIAGQFIITTDSGNIYFDLTSTDRKLIANKYTLPAATTSSLGGIKSGDALSVDSSGNVSIPGAGHTHVVSGITDLTVSANEINLLKGVTSNVQTQLNSKVNNTLTINSKPLTSNIQLTSSDVGAVPTSRKINNKALSTDISLTASDVSAIPTSSRAAANGVASLDSSKKIPISQIPAIFIHGYYSGGNFYSNSSLTTLITGEENKLYADLTSKGLYLYKDGAFVEVGSTLKLGTTSTTAFRGDYGNTLYTNLMKTVGSATKGIYFNNGVPTAMTYAVNKEVPSNAVFTDTHYTTGAKVGASATATANAATSNGSTYLNILDNTTVRDSHLIRGTGATTVTSDANGTITISSTDTNTTYSAATQSAAGLMSASDKTKLDGIATGANKYILPVAGSSLGGVKSGTDITVDSSGNVSVNDNSHAHITANITDLQSKLDAKLDRSSRGVANGLATLDSSGHVPTSQLPSYVDDVLEFNTKSGFPKTGEAGKIYVDLTTNLTYRWSGTEYVEISPSIALGRTSSTAFPGDAGKALEDKINKTVGSTSKPIYLNNGTFTECGSSLGVSVTGNAATATKATNDGSGQNIANTYIKGLSVSGTTITYTKGNNSTGTLTTQDTTYGVATTGANGLMSAADKTALNSVQSFAKIAPFDGVNNGFDQTRSVVIKGDGVMEVGRHIDFHYQKDSKDWYSRISVNSDGSLNFDKKLNANGGLSTNSIRNNRNYIVFPEDGSYNSDSSLVTGQIQITLPQAWSSTMIRFTVDVYNYDENSTVSYTIGGYIYSVDKTWYRTSAICTAPIISSFGNLTVRFCGTETASIVTIGEVDTVWRHPKIQIKDILIGHYNASSKWESGWNITIGTTQPTVQNTISNTNSAYKSRGFVNPVYLKLGNATKSFDGLSYNTSGSPLSFTLSEIGAAAASHTHNYAGSSSAGGAATSANKLNTNAGSASQPVYFANGVPVAIGYTIEKNVPSNAIFTDTNTMRDPATATPKANGTAAVGTSIKYAREDHVHPLQTSVNESQILRRTTLGTSGLTSALTLIPDNSLTYFSNVNRDNTGMPSTSTNNANGIIGFSRHAGAYRSFLCFDNSGDINYKMVASSEEATNGIWKKVAFIDTVVNQASALTTSAGSSTVPVYFDGGIPKPISYTIAKSVPSNAIFTDTHYTTGLYVGATGAKSNSAQTNGNVYLKLYDNDTSRANLKIVGSGASTVASDASGNITISSTDTKYTLPTASSSTLGGVKVDNSTIGITSGVIKVNNNSHTHTIANITNLQSSLDTIQSSLNTKLNTSLKGAAGGLAELGSDGKVLANQLPSYVDDVIEGYAKTVNNVLKFYTTSTGSTEISGESGKIYVDLNTNKTYRWSGSAFVVISETLALGETDTTAFRGDLGKVAYTHATNKGSAFNSGLYKITTNSQGHVTAATAVVKSDITGLGIPGQDTTYTAGTGLSLSNGAFSLSTSGVTAGTKGPTANVTGTSAAAIKIPRVTVDSYGRITNLQEYTYTSNSASTVIPKANGSATIGTDSGFARGDHVHPLQTTVSGNAGTATKLASSKNIVLEGDVSGNATTDFSTDTVIQTSSKKLVGLGICETSANVAEKIVTISNPKWTREVGSIISVKFTYSNTASNATLNVNGTGAASVYYAASVYTSASTAVHGTAGRYLTYMWDGTYWVWIGMGWNPNSDTYPASYSSTAAATAAKVATHTGYVLLANSYDLITFTNTNTATSNVTLNINSRGAKPLFYNGSAISSTNYNFKAGTYLLFYDGTNYYIRDDNKITANITGNASSSDRLNTNVAGSTSQPVYFKDGVPVAITGSISNSTTGNAATATKLQTPRNIKLGLTSKAFDGSQNIEYDLYEICVRGGNEVNFLRQENQNNTFWFNYRSTSVSGTDLLNNKILSYYFGDGQKGTDVTLNAKSFTGNAATATKLQTTRTINGTNFDGTAAITTANWGTTRTITIGNTGKSVNGSANVAWSLAEIGAVNKAGDTVTGKLNLDGRISLPSIEGDYITGFNTERASIVISTKQSQSRYHPYLKVITLNDHGFNIGGIRDQVGFWGYKAGRTENGTDWSFTVDAGTGVWTSTHSITAPTFNGNATSATKLQTARTITLTGGVTGSGSFDGSANLSIATTLANFDASKITSGTISIARLPAGALERCVVVADDAARFKLTTSNVQLGDTVKVTSTGQMYMVINESKLSSEDGYTVYTAGSATQATNDGNGQNIASTYIRGLSVSGQVITYTKGDNSMGTIKTQDTTYAPATQTAQGLMSANDKKKLDGIATGATANTAATTIPLVAAGNGLIGTRTEYARADHVHPAQTTISGNAGSATKLTSGTVGNTTTPIYFNDGKPVAITGTINNNAATATKANSVGYFFRRGNDTTTRDIDSSKMQISMCDSGTKNRPDNLDGYCMTFNWDNSGYGSQLYMAHGGMVFHRYCNASTWGNWIKVIDSSNYTSYTVTKTGAGASGTWGINISGSCAGNAATASKLTTSTVGAANNPVYFANGIPVATAGTLAKDISGNAETATKLNSGRTLRLSGDVTGNVQSDLSEGFNLSTTIQRRVALGKCETAATTAEKVVTIDSEAFKGWKREVGSIIGVKFTHTSTAVSVGLNVNNSGAASICYGGSVYTGSSSTVTGMANRYMFYVWDGTYWVWLSHGSEDNSNTVPTAYCSTAAGTAAKVATQSSYVATANTYNFIIFTTANTAKSAITLNINGQGAKTVYINGTVSSSSNYSIPAGTYILRYDGTYYHLRTDEKIPGNLAGNADTATKLTSNAGSTTQAVYFSDGKPVIASGTLNNSISGNAATATKLQTAKKINGTLFDGTGEITTAHWGTARNISIADSDSTNTGAKISVNGGTDATLKLPATIKATLNGNAATATKLQTAKTINGTSFDGTANITTANWGTARNISISNSDGTNAGTAISVNGGGNVTLRLPATIKATLTGNADSATRLQTARTIGLSGGAVGTATSFNGTANISIPVTGVKESYLSWGGKNFAGSFGPVDAAMIPDLGANRFAFGKPAGVTVEYSTDAGKTWTDYGATDAQKKSLFGAGGAFVIGKNTTNGAGDLNKQLRITIKTANFGVYTDLNKFAIYVGTNGSTGSWCSIDRALESTPETWVNAANKVTIDGWSGWNIINVSNFITYGNSTTTQYGRIRFTFGCTGTTSGNYLGLHVYRIMAFGGVGWITPSTMAKKGTIYDYDNDQNVTFPAQVTATRTIKSDTQVQVGDLAWVKESDGSYSLKTV